MLNDATLVYLLQLASPALPVGAYSYSEGLETLVDQSIVNSKEKLRDWLEQELRSGAVRIEAALIVRARDNFKNDNLQALTDWNEWLSAARETEELRQQSWQMGQSLLKLLLDLQPNLKPLAQSVGYPCNYAIAFGIAVAYWEIDIKAAIIGYLHSWASNLINAGVKLIPLGQTAGQQLLYSLHDLFMEVTEDILVLDDDHLSSCSWGLALASMAHQTQYTRLFRS